MRDIRRIPPWALALGLFLVFASLGLLSKSTFSDDDIGRYLNTRTAVGDVDRFLSDWNRPAFVLLYVLPAQLGFTAVELLTAFLAALTCYFVYRTARTVGEEHAVLAMIFVAVQPFYVMLSNSALVEPLAAFLLAVSLYLLYRGRMLSSALVASAIPLARLELSLFLVLLAVRYAVPGRGVPAVSRRRAWTAIALLPLGILVWNAAGAIAHGDPLYLIHRIVTGEKRAYVAASYAQYLRGYIYIVGPVVFAFSILGLVNAVRRRELLLAGGGVVLMLAGYTWLSSLSSMGQAAGYLRHVVTVSPLIGLIALRGFNVWYRERPSVFVIGLFALLALVCWRFLSVDLVEGFRPGNHPEYAKLAVLLVLTLIPVLVRRAPDAFRRRGARGLLLALPVVLGAGYAAKAAGIRHRTPEQEMMKTVSDWYREQGFQDRVTLCNHVLFYFYTSGKPEEDDQLVTERNLARAPLGTIVIWEGHYSHRLHGDVSLEDVEGDRDYRILNRFVDSENRAFAVVLERTVDGKRGGGSLRQGVYDHPGLGVHWDLRNAGEWQLEPQKAQLQLLRGRHPKGAVFQLQLERIIRFPDARQYLGIVKKQLSSQIKITAVENETRDGWVRFWGERGQSGSLVAIKIVPGRWSALVLRCVFPLGERAWMENTMTNLLAGLSLRTSPPADQPR